MSAGTGEDNGTAATPFGDLADFVAIPRVAALRLAPDGSWLAAAVQTLSADGKKYLTSIWRIDTQGGPPRRLTRSAEGEASPRFLPDGSLLFTSRRPDTGAGPAKPDGPPAEGAKLWLLPPGGGEARVVTTLPGGVAAVEVAAGSGTVVLSSPVLPAAQGDDTAADDARLRKERGDAGVSAILHESEPIRFWDHDLGPDQLRLFSLDQELLRDGQDRQDHEAGEHAGLRDLTPEPGRALDEQAFALTPDGASVVTGWWQWHPAGQSYAELVLIDVASGKRRVLLSDPEYNFGSPVVSPDGRYLVCERETQITTERPVDITLVGLDVNGPDAHGPDAHARTPTAGRPRPRRRWARSRRRRSRHLRPGPAARPGPVAGRTRLGAGLPRPVLRRGRRRAAAGVPARGRDRRPDPGDRPRRSLHRPASEPGRPVPVRAADHGGRPARPSSD